MAPAEPWLEHVPMPAYRVDAVAPVLAAAVACAARPSAGVVMVVDDNALVRRSSVRMLQRLGYQVLSAGSGQEALQAAQTQSLDCVLCDVAMPGMTGPELATALFRSRPHLRIIFVSGYPPGPMGEPASPTHFLQKPFSITQLASTLRTALGTG